MAHAGHLSRPGPEGHPKASVPSSAVGGHTAKIAEMRTSFVRAGPVKAQEVTQGSEPHTVIGCGLLPSGVLLVVRSPYRRVGPVGAPAVP